MSELPVIFECDGNQLCGIVHVADSAIETGVLIVVGGSQYRVGGHRQFTLMARYLAKNAISTMRFDYAGMGDSLGEKKHFSDISGDIASAIDLFFSVSHRLKHVVIWGLCDAASAALLYAHQDERVKGLVLLNPWVHTEVGQAKAYLRHYYVRRLFDGEFTKKLISGDFDFFKSLKSLASNIHSVFFINKELIEANSNDSWIVKMLEGVVIYNGKILIVLSGDDMTAREFSDRIKYDAAWRQCFKEKKAEICEINDADHTFSSYKWRKKVAKLTCDFVRSL